MTGYGSIREEEMQYLTNKGNQFIGCSQQRFFELKKYVDEGNWSWKVAGLIAGLGLMTYSTMSFLGHLIRLSPATAIVDLYLFIFGSIACILECKEQFLPRKYLEWLKREALFLYRPYGRAMFYFFIGILVLATGGTLGFIIGIYVASVGVIVFISSRDALMKLNQLKQTLAKTETELTAKFKEFDRDNSGFLDAKELAALCQSLGTNLTIHQLEAAIMVLDSNGDGKISYNEFLDWWKGSNQDDVV